MADTRAGRVRITYTGDEGRQDVKVVVVTTGDKLRAGDRVRKEGGGTDEEVLTIATFLAAKRAKLPLTETDDYLAWADHVVELEPMLTERKIAELEAVGDLTAEQAGKARALMALEDGDTGIEQPAGDAVGEAAATRG